MNGEQFLIGINGYRDYTPMNHNHYHYVLFDMSQQLTTPFLGRSASDNIRAYYKLNDRPQLTIAPNGAWLLQEFEGLAFVDSSRTIYSLELYESYYKLIYIAGRINNQYLCVRLNYQGEIDFFLNDLLNSPNIETSENKKILFQNYQGNYYPDKVIQLNDSLCISKPVDSDQLDLWDFNDSTFIYRKNIFNGYFKNWTIKNDIIYIDRYNRSELNSIEKCRFNYKDSSLTENVEIFSSDKEYVVNREFNHLAYITNDTLYLFDIKLEQIIKRWDVSSLLEPNKLIIGKEDIFLHHITNVTSIKENKIINDFHLSQNYPNPFNPSTTIEYTIPRVETSRDLSLQINIYNILGKKIKTLYNGTAKPGNHKIKFDGTNLPSGTYFVQMICRDYRQTIKTLLLK